VFGTLHDERDMHVLPAEPLDKQRGFLIASRQVYMPPIDAYQTQYTVLCDNLLNGYLLWSFGEGSTNLMCRGKPTPSRFGHY